MKYRLYKLQFLSPIHFGSDTVGTSLEEADLICHSDTFFSALCSEYIKLNGYKTLDDIEFKKLFDNNDLLISSLFPYKNNSFYIPRPMIISEKNTSDNNTDNSEKDKKHDRKAMKKISYIQISHIQNYLKGVKNNDNSFLDFLENIKELEDYNNFAKYSLIQKVGLRNNDEKNALYDVGAYYFNVGCGLYFILGYKSDSNLKLFESVLESLKYSGIGGKRTSGYGLFEYKVEEDINMFEFENKNESNYKMLLSLYSPFDDSKEDKLCELSNIDFNKSYYSLIKRNGFIYSPIHGKNLIKRKSLSMFKEGSCFYVKDDIKGYVLNVNNKDRQGNVYRYGKALCIYINF
ncbi:type III-A CRISPR-associated RAMP protein Csm4 [Brachyspira alvinipulli]|uniref:type III-A CRISPR-associated RAMP protein Csm4 n=1 Tax=Brachyspira alvinipulli TaxID=84379 RepID=UPI000484640D|nr:type III-A CRISPR-associated RAMP protein Csm4 [Brachyspira alvinipulli]